MKNPKLETKLRIWFKEMVSRYKWLSIKFEYSKRREIYLVSYSPIQEIEKNASFIEDSMSFEEEINIFYGDYSPLFCDEENLFKLSSDAEVIDYGAFESFNVSITETKNTYIIDNFSQGLYQNQESCPSFKNIYALAA